jgi:hypothetical protein
MSLFTSKCPKTSKLQRPWGFYSSLSKASIQGLYVKNVKSTRYQCGCTRWAFLEIVCPVRIRDRIDPPHPIVLLYMQRTRDIICMTWPCKIGENKTFNSKDITSFRPLLDIQLLISISKFCVCSSSSVTNMIWNRKRYCNIPDFDQKSTEMCVYVNNFLERHPWTRMKMCVQLYSNVNCTMYHSYSGSKVAPKKIIH